MERRTAVRLTVRGQVQGVFFRASTREEAQALGLSGWVRNLPDGGVEILAEGENALVGRLIAWCRHGPPSAEVRDVEILPVEPAGLEGFHIKR